MYLAPLRVLKATRKAFTVLFVLDYFKIFLQRPSSTLFGSNTKTRNKLSGPPPIDGIFWVRHVFWYMQPVLARFHMLHVHVAGFIFVLTVV